MKPDWFPDWSGDVCAIVASGPSVSPETVSDLRGACKVVVVNNSYLLAPWADLLYAADGRWWNAHRAAGRFQGVKVTPDRAAAEQHKLRRVDLVTECEATENRIYMDPPGTIGRGGHSGFQALNLALQFGVRKVMLVGFDFCGEHWHGPHSAGLRNPRPGTLVRWAATMDEQASAIAALGAEVLNASQTSVLKAYRKVEVRDALEGWRQRRAA